MLADAKKLFTLAIEASKREDLLGTISYLEQGLAVDPSHSFYWAWLGAQYNEREQYAAAFNAFERAIALDRNSPTAYSGLGEALEALGRLEEAEVALRRSVDLEPTSFRYVLLGDVQATRGRLLEAEKSFRAALRLTPDDEEAMYNLALLVRRDRPEEAIALLRRAVQIDAAYAEAYAELGFALAGQQKFEEAEVMLRIAVELKPELTWSRIYLANLLTSQGRHQEAQSELSVAVELAPLLALPHSLLGECLLALESLPEAVEQLRRAAEIDPSDSNTAYRLGKALMDSHHVTEGKEWLQRALHLNPDTENAGEIRDLLDFGY